MAEFVDFKEIMAKVSFEALLQHLDIPFERKGDEVKGENFIANLKKGQYFNPKGSDKGSVINFLSNLKNITPREAGLELKHHFLTEHKPKRELPNLPLTYTQEVEKLGISRESAERFEVGMVKQRSIMAGKVAFKIYDQSETFTGYIGRKDDGWFYPKGFKRNFLYNGYRSNGDYCILVNCPVDCIRLHQIGFPYTVALLGVAVTEEQKAILAGFRRIFYISRKPDLSLCQKAFVKTVDFEITPDTKKEQIENLF